MKDTRNQATEYAREHFRGVWAATATPFDSQFRRDEAGFWRNLRHWLETLKLGRPPCRRRPASGAPPLRRVSGGANPTLDGDEKSWSAWL